MINKQVRIIIDKEPAKPSSPSPKFIEFFTTATITAFVDLPFVILFIFIIFYVGGPIGYISIGTMVIAVLFSFFI
jgi:ABC-type protease/lipase transport system fused ATPase/permease subunit